MSTDVFAHIDGLRDELIHLQKNLVAIPALGPLNGGEGEKAKADWLMGHLAKLGITDVRELNAPADDVPCGYRPNVAVVIPGKDTSRTFWVMSHTDVVPPGDLGLWTSDPYELQMDGDYIVGRGVEDNHQGLVSSLLVAKALKDLDITPEINFGMLFVADEETGSTYGLDYVVREHEDIFNKNDMFLVPDFGDDQGEMLEIAEKSMMWLKATVNGKQCHASTPDIGVNSLVACSALVLRLRDLLTIYDQRDLLFDPPYSTFEPTKKEANVENVNTIPGRDVFYIDCRVLPAYDLDEIMGTIREMADEIEEQYGVTVEFETVQREQAAPATNPDCETVRVLIDAIKGVYDNDPAPIGIGGGTVAAFLRRAGYDAVVWSRLMHNAHQPNERSSIPFTLGDAKVMARVLLGA